MDKTYEELDAELVAAAEADDTERASTVLKQIEDLTADAQDGAKEAPSTMDKIVITQADLGNNGDFESPLAQLNDEQIDQFIVKVQGTDNKIALILPGTSLLDGKHDIHIRTRPDVRRAARGLALAATGAVDMDNQTITGVSGRVYTIREGKCIELVQTAQPNFDGTVTIIKDEVDCKGHLDYRKNPNGKGFTPTGKQLLRDKHHWALEYAYGYFATCAEDAFDAEGNSLIRTEIGASVGTGEVREAAQAQFTQWNQNATANRERQAEMSQAINAEKAELGIAPEQLLPAKNEIGRFLLANGKTVEQEIVDMRGRQFALLVEVTGDGPPLQFNTRTSRNLQDLASAVAIHFAYAKNNNGELKALELIAR